MSEDLKKQEERTDEQFRNSLGGIRIDPDPMVWKKVDRSLLLNELIRFNVSNVPRAMWLAVPAAIIIIGIIIYFAWPGEEAPLLSPGSGGKALMAPTISSDIWQPVEPLTQPAGDQVQQNAVTPGDPGAAGMTEDQQARSGAGASGLSLPVTSSDTPDARSDASDAQTLPAATSEPVIIEREGLPHRIPVIILTEIPLHAFSVCSPQRIENTPVPPSLPGGENIPVPLSKPFPYEGFGVGVNITPEMVFYKNSSNSFKYDYTFDLGVNYSFGRFFIQGGAGFTYSTGIGNYTIDYLKNDSVGYYVGVKSFVFDPENPQKPVFQTKLITVFDSVQYIYDYSTKNNYYYLNVPVSIGYRIIHKPAWRLSVDAGFVYAWLIHAHEPYPEFYLPESRVLEIESDNPERTRNNLGLTGGIKFEYRFAEKWYLAIEPTFKYYLKMVEEKSAEGMKQPYSVGLRAGIWYQLDIKKRKK